jgi:cytidine deaminase
MNQAQIDRLIAEANKCVGEFELSRKSFSAGAVSAALITAEGNIYTGICVDLACGIGFCAEHSAVAEMLKSRETEIKAVVAVSESRILPPCGRCRELMVQVNAKNKDADVIVGPDKTIKLRELLPNGWLTDSN